MSTVFRAGPAHLFIGDPTEANGTGMHDCGPTESATFDAGISMTGVQTAFTGDAYEAEGVYSLPPNPTLSVELYDNALENLEAFFLASSLEKKTGPDAEALGLGGEIKLIAKLPTVCIVPASERAQGAYAKGAIWLPGALIVNVSGFQHGRLTAGSNAASPFTVEFSSARRRVDQDGEPIPVSAQFGFIGQPAAFDLEWTLPAVD